MSITKDFELNHRGECEGVGYLVDPVEQLLAHTRALEAMLKTQEWTLCDDGEWVCLECWAIQSAGHEQDCQLAKLLEGVEE